jgi:hypothetical protein
MHLTLPTNCDGKADPSCLPQGIAPKSSRRGSLTRPGGRSPTIRIRWPDMSCNSGTMGLRRTQHHDGEDRSGGSATGVLVTHRRPGTVRKCSHNVRCWDDASLVCIDF